jgi:hypothetical protein
LLTSKVGCTLSANREATMEIPVKI